MRHPDSHDWLKQAGTPGFEVRQSDEDWIGSYDNDLAEWDYRAGLRTASLLKPFISASSTIQDPGCGTGLVGAALRHVGFTGDIDGIDLSPSSLEKARERGTLDGGGVGLSKFERRPLWGKNPRSPIKRSTPKAEDNRTSARRCRRLACRRKSF
jgi:SAM-dependent methyltransferase